jgi:hypothetical protein
LVLVFLEAAAASCSIFACHIMLFADCSLFLFALAPPSLLPPPQAFQQMLKDIIARSLDIKVDQTTLEYVSRMTTLLFNSKNYDFDEWADAMVPYLTAFLSQDGAESVCRTYLGK